MATPGKKGKKQKGKTVPLNDFLSAGTTTSDGSKIVVASSWADEMDDYDEAPYRGTEQFVLPTAPRAARGPNISDDKIPREPPFTAYVANLSYDVDEVDVMKFFGRLKIKGVRLPREGDLENGRLKGFGYADFEDRDSLIEALSMSESLIKSRKVRIDIASHAGKSDRDSGRNDGYSGNRGRFEDDDRTAGDWRSGPPPPPRDDGRKDRYEPPRERTEERRGFSFDRRDGFDRDRRDTHERDQRDSFDRDRRDNFDRDRRDNFDRDRRDGFDRERRDNFDRRDGFERRDDRDRRDGFDRDRRDGFDRDRRDGFDRDRRDGFDRDRRDGFERRDDRRGNFDRRSPEREGPKERPRLQLAKRSVQPGEEESANNPSQASIFGGAKPVDTTKREKEIEEKLSKPGEKPTKSKDEVSHHEDTPIEENASGDKKPRGVSIFGQAKPVDTSAREKEIEERLKKRAEETVQTENGEKDRKKSSSEENNSGQDKTTNETKHADERYNSNRSVSRRDDRDRDQGTRGGPRREQPKQNLDRKQEKDRATPPLKKFEEKPPPNFAGANKFSFLQDSEEAGSGRDSE